MMNKGKKSYTLLRQWKMLQLLPSRYPKDAATLRDELEHAGFKVDVRTVQRDLRELSEVFPLVAIEGKPISWRWDKNAMSFDVPGMDQAAAMTLKMVGDYIQRLLPTSCSESLAPNLKRAHAILNELGHGSFADWPDKVRVIPRSQPLLPPPIDRDILDLVYQALFKDQQFMATYRKKGSGEITEYLVNPLGLVVSEPILYLVVTLWDYPDIRLLALHRFTSVTLTDYALRRPKGFSLDQYIDSGAIGFASTGSKTILLEALFEPFAAEHLRESPLSLDQTLVEQDGDILVRAKVLDTQQLRWWLLGFGDAVEVLGPQSLRAEFAEISSNMAGYYED